MVFGRRKSSPQVNANQEEVEPRRRNRLSKPLTNKSSSNLYLLAVPDSAVASRNVSVEAVEAPPSAPASSQLTEAEQRQQIKAHLFDSNEEPQRTVSKRSSWIGVAALVNKFEATPAVSDLPPPPSISPPKQRASMTSLFSSRRSSLAAKHSSLTNANSMERTSPIANESGPEVLSPTVERVSEPSFPTTRRSSFIPGAATRKASGVDSIKEEQQPVQVQPEPKVEVMIEEEVLEDVAEDSDALSFSEGDDEDWIPPPQDPRSETPQGLDYTHLGGLRLGSLQVVNGRASPATTVASRQLLAHMAGYRHTSSEYGDSDFGDGPPFMLGAYSRTPPTHSREVSWYSHRSSKLHNVEVFELPENVVEERPAVDLAASMAAEYIAELPDSPYKTRKSSSPLSFKQGFEETAEESMNTSSPYTLRKSRSLETISHRSSSPVPSEQSSTGSVLRIASKRNEIDDELFDDETLGPSRTSPEPDHVSLDSFHSWHSSPKPEFAKPEAFESAVEFQRFPSPSKSRQRSPQRSPMKLSDPQLQTSFENPVAPSQRLGLPGGMVQSDSGYSSNNSVRSSSWERKSTMEQQPSQSPHKPEPQSQSQSQSQSQPQSQTGQLRIPSKLHRPILKSWQTAPAVESVSKFRPAAPSSTVSTTSDIPKLDTEKPKIRKKLQKRRIFGKGKKELYVQNVASLDDLTIPAIPLDVQTNLQVRSQQVPELEKTYRSMHHIRNQKSMSVMNLPQVELRFPSPDPEPIKPAKSRRRSWLPGSREEKAKPKPDSTLTAQAAKSIINDFGSVNYYLGGSPYDLAHESAPMNPRSRQNSNRLSPFNVSTKPPRPRSMFDDKTATEIARMRSSSIRERDAWNVSRKSSTSSRRSSFNDRGGIPGKKLRPASLIGDAPPMPPIPSPDVLQRRLSGMQSHAPPPPPRSPRLMNMEPSEEDFEAPPPPPPSHSPRPMDVSDVGDPWAAQAAMWKARRASVGEALNGPSHHDNYDYNNAPVEEPLYPEIPLRSQATCYQAQRNYSIQPGSYAYEFDHDPSYNTRHYGGPQDYNDNHSNSNNIPPHHHQSHRQSYQFLTQPHDPNYTTRRPLPKPSPAPSIRSSHSHHSNRSHYSYASSLTEDFHPSTEETRTHPPPEFGRYSGGMQYGYERDNGFGGSAGTRSVSGKADGVRKGVKLREGWGVDLGDVPVIAVVRPVR